MVEERVDGAVTPTADRILAVALDQFLRRGYEAATTREITAALGITPAALYYHYASKEACLLALVTPYLDAVEAVLARRGRPAATEQEAGGLLAELHEVLVEHRRVVYLIDRDLAVANSPLLAERVDRVTDVVHAHLAGPDPDQTARIRASASIGALRRPVLRLEATEPLDADEVIDAALAALQFDTGRQR